MLQKKTGRACFATRDGPAARLHVSRRWSVPPAAHPRVDYHDSGKECAQVSCSTVASRPHRGGGGGGGCPLSTQIGAIDSE